MRQDLLLQCASDKTEEAQALKLSKATLHIEDDADTWWPELPAPVPD